MLGSSTIFGSTTNDRQRAFFLASLISEESDFQSILPYLSEADALGMNKAYQDWQTETHPKQQNWILAQLKQGMAPVSPLQDVHSDWLAHALQNETPRLIACILRYLPSQQVQAILDKLPDEKIKKLPLMSETFSVAPEVIHVIKRGFEQSFASRPLPQGLPQGLPPGGELQAMDRVPQLPARKLHLFFRELGLGELAIAFGSLKEQTIQLILKRLPALEAVLLQEKLTKNRQVTLARLQMAQNHVLSLDLHEVGRKYMVYQLGFLVYAKSALPRQYDGATYIQKKFSFELGDLLKKALQKNLPLNTEKTVETYREDILAVLGAL